MRDSVSRLGSVSIVPGRGRYKRLAAQRKAGYALASVPMSSRRAQALIQNVTHLLRARRFLPLFATQFLGAFNDSLFKQAVVLFVTYQLYSNAAKEFQFSAIAQGAVHPALLPVLGARRASSPTTTTRRG